MNLADAMERAQVLDFELQKQLVPHMRGLVPLPGIYDPSFIAANQAERADNLIKGSKQQQVRINELAKRRDVGVVCAVTGGEAENVIQGSQQVRMHVGCGAWKNRE